MSCCVNCKEKEINNKHFKLCWLCNKKRLDENKRDNNSKPSRSKKSIRIGATNGTRTYSKLLKEAKAIQKSAFRAQIFSERPNVCTGCHHDDQLTLSHTIPVSLRKDLEFNSLNVEIECMRCHTKWEHGDAATQKTLLNFRSKISWIKKIDPEYYERRFNTE